MGIVRLGGAFRHRNLSRRAALRFGGGRRPRRFPHWAPHMRFGLCPCWGNKNRRNGAEWQHVNRDGQTGNNCWGEINQLGMHSPPSILATATKAKWRIKFTPLQTCLSLSLCSVVGGAKDSEASSKYLTVSETYLLSFIVIFSPPFGYLSSCGHFFDVWML